MEPNKEIEEALECPVCLSLPSVDNKPRGLPCLHTICDGCVRDLVGRAAKVDPSSWGFECPVCRATCDVPVDQLATDMTAIRVLEALRTKKVSDSKPKAVKEPEIDLRKLEVSKPVFEPLEVGGHRRLEQKLASIPGNWSTNPFLKDFRGNEEKETKESKEPKGPELPPKALRCPVPVRPKRPPPTPPTPATPSQLYVALYDYRPARPDELALKKGELYEVTAKCADNWFKGTCKRTLKSGSMPGNFLQLAAEPRKDANLKLGRFVVAENYPALEKEELDLAVGDEVIMTEKRADGWCQGVLVKSGRTGVFPFSFVKKKT